MIRFGKTAQNTLSALSLLAEVYDGGRTRLSSADIAKRRKLARAVVAKVLTVASGAGLVDGTRGPGGGYWLKRAPGRIALLDIVEAVESEDEGIMCPFGPRWCGKGEPCPMHDELARRDAEWTAYLRRTTLAVFARVGGEFKRERG